MQVTMFFADAASIEGGSVFNVLRGGVDRFQNQANPAPIKSKLVIHLFAEPFDAGKYQVELRILDADGKAVGKFPLGEITVAESGGRRTYALDIEASLAHGKYVAHFYLGGRHEGYCPFQVQAPPPAHKPS